MGENSNLGGSTLIKSQVDAKKWKTSVQRQCVASSCTNYSILQGEGGVLGWGGSQAKYNHYRKIAMLSQPSSARSNFVFISPDKKKKTLKQLKITLCHSIFSASAIDSYLC